MRLFLYTLLILFSFTSAFAQQSKPRRERIMCNQGGRDSQLHNGAWKLGIPGKGQIPCVGSPFIPVILVEFADKPFNTSHEDYNLFCNGSLDGKIYTGHGSYGGVRDYFINVSDSAFQPEFKVIGPVTLSKGYAFYGQDGRSKDINLMTFYREACEAAVNQASLDWSTFDNDNNGIIDFAFFVFAGEGQNAFPDETDLIWPAEMSTVQVINTDFGQLSFGGFGCTNELFEGKLDGIGTMIHELSHGIGLPDMYDYNARNFGMDYWDIMDAGNYCYDSYFPCGYSGYELDFMGWRSIVDLPLDIDTVITLAPISERGLCYRITSPTDANDYYTLENRQNKRQSYDLHIGQMYEDAVWKNKTHGLMITHINYHRNAWTGNFVNTGNEYLTILHADNKIVSSIQYNNNKVSFGEYSQSMIGDLYPGLSGTDEVTILGQKLKITEEEDGNIVLQINNGVIIDAISQYPSLAHQQDFYYDLKGRRLDCKPMARGIYIKNGLKYVVH